MFQVSRRIKHRLKNINLAKGSQYTCTLNWCRRTLFNYYYRIAAARFCFYINIYFVWPERPLRDG